MKSLSPIRDPDPELVERAKQGDRESLEALLVEIGPAVRQWALAHTGDPDAAEDLCQEVFLIMFKKISSFRGQARFLTWLYSVTRNRAIERHRRIRRREKKMSRFQVEIRGDLPTMNPSGAGLDREHLGDVLNTFVSDLPQRQREVFQLSELQGLTSVEIGGILRLNPGSVRAALLKARRTLRRRILEIHPELAEEYLP